MIKSLTKFLNHTERFFMITAVFLAVISISLCIIGVIEHYTPVPFWDMWNGYLGFYGRVQSGEWSAWWSQHNEHRIILSRILFWLDIQVFGGKSIFLLTVNIILIGAACLIFTKWLVTRTKDLERPQLYTMVALIWSLGFFWSQNNNITWGFQSQFFLAQLLPLASLYWAQKSTGNGQKNYLAACVLGLLSAGTMANGVLALPILSIFYILTRQLNKAFFVSVLAAAILWLYFTGYHKVDGHGAITTALQQHPLDYARYVLAYMGSPFYYLADLKSLVTAEIFGAIIILSCAFLVLKMVRRQASPSEIAGLLFITYIGGTAFGTAGGRLIFGLDTAVSSRYTTPSLMAWLTIIVLHFSNTCKKSMVRSGIGVIVTILIILIIPYQKKALKVQNDEIQNQNVAALALSLGIDDLLQVGITFPSVSWAIEESKYARTNNLSIFGTPELKNAVQDIGKLVEPINTAVCLGHIDITESIDENGYDRVTGWFYDPHQALQSQFLKFIGSDGRAVGYAYLNGTRDDVAQVVSSKAIHSGFKGYIFSRQQGLPVTVASGRSCSFTDQLPYSAFNIIKGSTTLSLARSTQIDDDSTMEIRKIGESDVIRTKGPIGSITLRLRKNQRVLYRSGQDTTGLTIKVGDSLSRLPLPYTTSWVSLAFTGSFLPEQFEVTMQDDSDGQEAWFEIQTSSNTQD